MKRTAYDKRQAAELAELRRRVRENSEPKDSHKYTPKPPTARTLTYEFFRIGKELIRVK